jgi:hypothetical protein
MAGHDTCVFDQLIDNVDIVDDIKDESLNFGEEKDISLVVKRSVTIKLFLKILLVVCKFSLLDGLCTTIRERDHFGKAADL